MSTPSRFSNLLLPEKIRAIQPQGQKGSANDLPGPILPEFLLSDLPDVTAFIRPDKEASLKSLPQILVDSTFFLW
jgi:hypothetical protein